MPDEKKPDAGTEDNIRQELVNTAVNFLLNIEVINKPHVNKIAFLKNKGLTGAEITLAFERAASDPRYNEILRISNTSNNPPVPVYSKPVSFWSQLGRFNSSLIVLGAALFGVHYIYKNYIEPLIFGDDSKRNKAQKLEKQLFDITNSLSQLERHISSLEESIQCQKVQMDKFLQNEANEYYPSPFALRELKTEIASVKSLLLNRHQFPALPKVTPTIPQWQLPSKENDDCIKQNGDDCIKQNGDDCIKQNGETYELACFDEHKSSFTKPNHECNSEDDANTTEQNNEIETTLLNEFISAQQEFPEELSNDPLSS